jgi:AcrR family transcriptional regulator
VTWWSSLRMWDIEGGQQAHRKGCVNGNRGMARLLDQRKALMKNAIYEAAVEILTRDGFDAMTMDHVAEQAGVAKGSLYNYFPNKLELLRFVRVKSFEPLEESVQTILDSDADAIQKLRCMFRAWFEYLDSRRRLFNFLFNEHAIHKLLRPEELSGQQRAVQNLTIAIEQGVVEGTFRQVDSRQFATLLFGAARQVCDEQVRGDDPWPMKEMLELVMDFFIRGAGPVCPESSPEAAP